MITCTSCKHLTNTDEDGMILTCRLSGASCFTNDLPFTTLPGCPKKERNSMLNELAKQIHEIAVAHGWWEDERPFPEIVALCHSELSEALEEYRRGRPMAYVLHFDETEEPFYQPDMTQWDPRDKPEGIAVEMADCLIRILDWCAKEGIDIDAITHKKITYNRTRPYRHGNKMC